MLSPIRAVLLASFGLTAACGNGTTESSLMDSWAVARQGEVVVTDAGYFADGNRDTNSPTYKDLKHENYYQPGGYWRWQDANKSGSCGPIEMVGIAGGVGPHFVSGCADHARAQTVVWMRKPEFITTTDMDDYINNHSGDLKMRVDLEAGVNAGWGGNLTTGLWLPGGQQKWLIYGKVTVTFCNNYTFTNSVTLPLSGAEWAPLNVPLDIPNLRQVFNECHNIMPSISADLYGSEVHFHSVKWTIFERF